MDIQENIINKVAQSGLLTVDLADYAPKDEIIAYDVKDNLFHGLILKEKDFREFVQQHSWSNYQDKTVAIICSTDAIIPTWCYMILANKLSPYAKSIHFGTVEQVREQLFNAAIQQINFNRYQDQRVVVKGCGAIPIPESVFILFTNLLSKVAKSIMYGEPCSTVPVYKRKS